MELGGRKETNATAIFWVIAEMEEKESLRRLEMHPEDEELVVTRTTGRRLACLVAIAALATATLLLFIFGTGGFCHHVSSLSAAATDAQTWPEGLEASSDRHQALTGNQGSLGGNEGSDNSASTELFRNRAGPGVGTPVVLRRQSANVTTTSATATATVLEDFEVHQPILTPSGATPDDGDSTDNSSSVEDSCSVVLMDHVFAYSYGEPYVGDYTPPSCAFNRVVMNFTVVSEGRQ